jgi:hypothetical protein
MITGFGRVGGFLLVAILLAQCSRPPSADLTPPEGYRAIVESEFSSDPVWQFFAETFPTPDRAEGDFDGDGELDHARLWLHGTGERWVLVAYLSSIPDTPVTVYESERRMMLGHRPIRTIPPGVHKTHRYFGIGPGHGDTTAVVHLTHDAINLGWVESEGTTYVWNKETHAFDSIAMY